MKNPLLIDDLNLLCKSLKYTTTVSTISKDTKIIYVLSESLEKVYKDYKTLLKTYTEASLGYKEKRLKQFVERRKKSRRYLSGNRAKMLDLLVDQNLTINELADKLNMTRQGARYLTKKLLLDKQIEVKEIVKFGNYKYGVKI